MKKSTDEGKFLFVGDAEDVDQCQDADNTPHSLETGDTEQCPCHDTGQVSGGDMMDGRLPSYRHTTPYTPDLVLAWGHIWDLYYNGSRNKEIDLIVCPWRVPF